MPAYVLGPRQRLRYVDLVDLYKPIGQVGTAANLESEVPQQVVLDYSSVRCALETKKEASVPLPIGRSNYDITDTTDLINFHTSQEVGDGWYVLLKTPGHAEAGTWFEIQGEAQHLNFRAKSQVLLLKKATAPPFAS